MARVQAEVIAEGRNDRAIEPVVERLGLEPTVAEALSRKAEADELTPMVWEWRSLDP